MQFLFQLKVKTPSLFQRLFLGCESLFGVNRIYIPNGHRTMPGQVGWEPMARGASSQAICVEVCQLPKHINKFYPTNLLITENDQNTFTCICHANRTGCGETGGHGYATFMHILMLECEHPLNPKGIMEWWKKRFPKMGGKLCHCLSLWTSYSVQHLLLFKFDFEMCLNGSWRVAVMIPQCIYTIFKSIYIYMRESCFQSWINKVYMNRLQLWMSIIFWMTIESAPCPFKVRWPQPFTFCCIPTWFCWLGGWPSLRHLAWKRMSWARFVSRVGMVPIWGSSHPKST